MKSITRVIIAVLFCVSAMPVMSDESIMYIPILGYEYLSLESRAVHSPLSGAIVLGDDFMVSGFYQYKSFPEKTPPDFPDGFHSIDTMLETHWDKHQILSSFKSESDKPLIGGWATFQATAIYNYQIVERDKFSFRLGLGASLGDFGIELDDGRNWPLIPVPFLGLEYNSHIINAGFDFVVGPHLSLTLFPEKKIRLSGEAEINNYRDLHDFLFTTAVHYRFFSGDIEKNDIAGLSAGLSNSNFGFTPGGSNDPYEIQYYSVFTELDLTVLKITGGYVFNGQERLGEDSASECGNGYFISLQAMYQF